MVEEWGCNLGRTHFLTEEVLDSTTELLEKPNNNTDTDEVQGEWELDELVNNLQEEWRQHEQKVGSPKSFAVPLTQKNSSVVGADMVQQTQLEYIQTLPQPKCSSVKGPECIEQQLNIEGPFTHKETVPRSLDWLSNIPICDGGTVFSSQALIDNVAISSPVLEENSITSPNITLNKKKGGNGAKSIGFMKKVARMPEMDRKQ
jgi:hypothetical protein